MSRSCAFALLLGAAALVGVWLSLRSPSADVPSRSATATSDAAQAHATAPLESGSSRAELERSELAGAAAVEPAPAGSPPVTAKTPPRPSAPAPTGACVVRGRVLDEHDTPVAGRELWLAAVDERFLDVFDRGTVPLARATSGGDGAFAFDAIAPGNWRVGLAFAEPGAQPDVERLGADVVRVAVGPADRAVDVVLRVLRGLFVAGVVRDEHAAPVAECVVQLRQGTDVTTWVRTDASGVFELGPVASGTYQLVGGSAGVGAWEETAPRDVLAGTRGLELVVTRGAVLRGKLAGPAVDARVEIARIEAGAARATWGVAAKRSVFQLQGLSAGTFDVFVSTRGGQVCCARVELARGEQRELELTPEPGALVKLSNPTETAVTVELRSAGRMIGSRPLAKGASLEARVPAGELEISFADAAGARLATRTRSLKTGETYADVVPAQ